MPAIWSTMVWTEVRCDRYVFVLIFGYAAVTFKFRSKAESGPPSVVSFRVTFLEKCWKILAQNSLKCKSRKRKCGKKGR